MATSKQNRLSKAFSLLCILCALVMTLNVVVNNPYFHAMTRSIINAKIKKYSNLVITYQAMELTIAPIQVTLYGLKVTHRDHPDTSLIEAAHLKARVSPFSLFMGTPRMSLLEVNELDVTYPLPYPLQDIFIMDRKPTKNHDIEWPLNVNIPLDNLVMINSKVHFTILADNPNQPPDLQLDIKGLDFAIDRFENLDDFSGKLNILSLDLATTGQHILKQVNVASKFEQKQGVFRTDKFAVTSAELNAAGTFLVHAQVERHASASLLSRHLYQSFLKSIKLVYRGEIKEADLAILGRYLTIDKTSGKAHGDVNIKVDIPIKEPGKVTWSAGGKGEAKQGVLYGFLLHDSKVNYTINENAVTLDHIEIIKDGKKLGDGRGEIRLEKTVGFDFTAEPNDLPLSVLLPSLGVTGFDVLDTKLQSPHLRIWGTGDPFKMSVRSEKTTATQLVSPLIKMSTDKMPNPPTCKIDLALAIDSKRLAWDGTSGTCFNNNKQTRLNRTSDNNDDGFVTDTGKIKVSGSLPFDEKQGAAMHLSSAALPADVLSYFTQMPLEGAIKTDIAIKGPYQKLIVTADIDAKRLSIFSFPLQQVSGSIDIQTAQGMLNIKRLTAASESGGSIYINRGKIAFDREITSEFKGSVHHLEAGLCRGVAAWYDMKDPIDLQIEELDFDFKGPLMQPLAYQGKFTVDVKQGVMGNRQLFTNLKTNIHSDKNGIRSHDILYNLANLNLQLAIEVSRARVFSFEYAQKSSSTIEAMGLNLRDKIHASLKTAALDDAIKNQDDLQQLPYIGQYFKQADIKGRVRADMTLEGTLARLQGNFSTEIDNLEILGSSVGGLAARGFINGGIINVSEITQAGKSLMGRFNVNLDEPGTPFDWFFKFKRYDLRAITPFHHDPRNFAYLSGEWRMKGRFDQFWQSECKFTVDDLRLAVGKDIGDKYQKEVMRLKDPAELNCKNGQWTWQEPAGLTLAGSLGEITIATKQNELPANLDLALSGKVNLASAQRFVPFIDKMSGFVYLDGTIHRTIQDPDININFRDYGQDTASTEKEPLEINFTDVPPALRNLKFVVNYHDNVINVLNFSAEKGRGSKIHAAGAIALLETDQTRSILNIDFTGAELNRLPAPFIKTLDSTVSGHLAITGNRLPLKLAGNIVIDRAQSFTNSDVRDQILASLGRQRFSSISIPKEAVLNLDIRIQAADTIRIKNRGINAVLGGDFTIRGTDQEPLIGGRVNIPKGLFIYKRDFTITQGDIAFDEMLSPPDPKLNIVGQTVVAGYTVSVSVGGTASDPKVAMTVDPSTRSDGSPLSEKDILALLSSGTIPDVNSDANMGKELSNEALYLVLGQFEHPIERIFDMSGQNVVRQVYLDVHTSTETGGPIPRVNLPINITEDANLVFQVDQESNMTVTYEYKLDNNISLTGSIDKQNEMKASNSTVINTGSTIPAETDPGVDLKFRFTFP